MFSIMSFAFELSVKLIWCTFSLVTKIVYLATELSCLVGYVIVENSLTIYNAVLLVLSGFIRLITVLIEDYNVFVFDVFSTLSSVLTDIQHSAEFFRNYVVSLFFFLCSCVSSFVDSLITTWTAVRTVSSCLYFFLLLVEQSFLQLGLSVWNTVTEVPNSLIFVLKLLWQKSLEGHILLLSIIKNGLTSGFVSIYKGILQFPVKPVCGLSIGIIIGCIIFKTWHSLWLLAYRTWVRSIARGQQLVISGWQSFEGYVLWLLTNQNRERLGFYFRDRPNENISESSSDDSENSSTSDGANHNSQVTLRNRKTARDRETSSEEMDLQLCVVCQDKTRCIVTLPCRHVCLCHTCCKAVMRNQGLCPLCRQEITYAGRVYF